MDPSLPPAGVRTKRRAWPFRIRSWGASTILLAVLAAAILLHWFWKPRTAAIHRLAGYISDAAVLQKEYVRFHGKPLPAADVRQQFEDAAMWVQHGDYARALDVLQAGLKQAELPVMFNDLGVLYLQTSDRARALSAFREALARDAGYVPVRENLRRMKDVSFDLADPVSTELESNDSIPYANPVALDRPVDAAIGTSTDRDYFHVVTPPAPRDRVEIAIANRSPTLVPVLRIYDEEGSILPWGQSARVPGESLTIIIAPPPNTSLFLDISGMRTTTGAYTLTLKTLKAFDSYEPNDEIYSARKITLGERIEANIMDDADTDFYAFDSPRSGTVAIEIQNRSATLIPGLTVFTPEMRTSGFGPDVDRPGGSMHHTMLVQEGRTYYVQVWAQARTVGEYTLLIQ